MSKPCTFPSLYDESLQISITKLKELGYLKPDQIISGILNWSRNGNPIGRISFTSDFTGYPPFVELDYKYGEEPRKYRVLLSSIPSNLNRGVIWYFICPKTYKRCRKLYSIVGYFFHREAFRGVMYECQTQSKKTRLLYNTLGPFFKSDKLYGELHKKHFKKLYAGKPTKKYMRIMDEIKKAESIPLHEVEKAMAL